MSEALIREAGSLLSEFTDLPVSTNGWSPYRSQTAGECPKLPTLQAGQLWYVELPSTEFAFSPLEYQALTTANVVIYDRALATTVARLMPIGGYAEPATPRGDASDGFDRCIRFARDGWSVARLVRPGRRRVDMLRQLTERLLGSRRRRLCQHRSSPTPAVATKISKPNSTSSGVSSMPGGSQDLQL